MTEVRIAMPLVGQGSPCGGHTRNSWLLRLECPDRAKHCGPVALGQRDRKRGFCHRLGWRYRHSPLSGADLSIQTGRYRRGAGGVRRSTHRARSTSSPVSLIFPTLPFDGVLSNDAFGSGSAGGHAWTERQEGCCDPSFR
jgi:hypothetical protein